MGVGKIIQIIAVLVAVVAGLWAGFPQAALAIAILGAVAGWFIPAEDRQRILIAVLLSHCRLRVLAADWTQFRPWVGISPA